MAELKIVHFTDPHEDGFRFQTIEKFVEADADGGQVFGAPCLHEEATGVVEHPRFDDDQVGDLSGPELHLR